MIVAATVPSQNRPTPQHPATPPTYHVLVTQAPRPSLEGWLADSTMEQFRDRATELLTGHSLTITLTNPDGTRDQSHNRQLKRVACGEIRPFGSSGFELVVEPGDWGDRITWHVSFTTPEKAAEAAQHPEDFDRLHAPVWMSITDTALVAKGPLDAFHYPRDQVRIERG